MGSRVLNRFGTVIGILTLFLILFYTLEPRKTAYSCRSFKTCISRGHSYNYNLDQEPAAVTSETHLRDGSLSYERKISNANPDTIFLVLSRDEKSWSKDYHSTRRTVYDFLDLLISTNLNLTDTSVAFMTASMSEYDTMKKATASFPFARTTILFRKESGPTFPYKDRHKPAIQQVRRASIAALRNYLMIRTLADETHVLWIDADVAEFSPNIVQKMMDHSTNNPVAGIMTARCQQGTMRNYDKNAWTVDRSLTILMDPVPDASRELAVQKLASSRHLMTEVIDGTTDSDLKSLDAVGGTILYMRAELVRQGVNFPTFNIVGTTWRYDGWTGLETEGICYMALRLTGKGMCWALGGSHFVRHSDGG